MRCMKSSNSFRQKVEKWLLGAEVRGEQGTEVLFCKVKNVLEMGDDNGRTTV